MPIPYDDVEYFDHRAAPAGHTARDMALVGRVDALESGGAVDLTAIQSQLDAQAAVDTAQEAVDVANKAVDDAQQLQIDAIDLTGKEDAGVAATLDAALQAQITANADLNTAQQAAITANIAAIAALQASIVKPDYEAAESDAAGILNKPELSQSETYNVAKAAADGYVKGVSRILWNGYQYILNTDAVLQAARGNADTVDQTVLPSDGDGSDASDWVVESDFVLDMPSLQAKQPAAGHVSVLSYHSSMSIGGGLFAWDASKSQSDHDGIFVIAPTATWPASWDDNNDVLGWYEATGATGLGCWVRSEVDSLKLSQGGLLPDSNASIQASALDQSYQLRAMIQQCSIMRTAIIPDVGQVAVKENIQGTRVCIVYGDVNILGVLDVAAYNNFTVEAESRLSTTLSATEKRGSVSATLVDTGAVVGDIIVFLSSEIASTGWNYLKRDIHIVTDVVGSVVSLAEPLEFDYVDSLSEVVIYKPASLNIQKIKLIGESGFVGAFSFVGMNGGSLTADVRHDFNTVNHGLQLQYCYGIITNRLDAYKGRYPYILHTCAHCSTYNVIASGSRHGVALSYYSRDCIVENVVGYDCIGVMDGHESIRPTWRNVRGYGELGSGNARGYGGTFDDIDLHYADSVTSPTFLYSSMQLTDFIDGVHLPFEDSVNNIVFNKFVMRNDSGIIGTLSPSRNPLHTHFINPKFSDSFVGSVLPTYREILIEGGELGHPDFRADYVKYKGVKFNPELTDFNSVTQENIAGESLMDGVHILPGYECIYGEPASGTFSFGAGKTRLIDNSLVEGLTKSLVAEHYNENSRFCLLDMRNTELRNCVPTSDSWVAATSYSFGETVLVGDDLFRCAVAGISGSSEPTWLLDRTTQTVDGTATWELFSFSLYGKRASEYYTYLRCDFTNGTPFPQEGSSELASESMPTLASYADDSAAGVAGLVSGDWYKTTAGVVSVKL